MLTIDTLCRFLEDLAPAELAEEWDNVGLLVGDRHAEVNRVMTCLTLTTASAAEAIARSAQLVVTHHPLPFRPVQRLTTDSPGGRLLLDLIAGGVGVFSPHTSFDSAPDGNNQRLAEGLGLNEIRPIVPADSAAAPEVGSGRWGVLAAAATLDELAEWVKGFLKLDRLQTVGAADAEFSSVAVACGSAAEFLEPAHALGCGALVTGEARFHACLEAEALGMGLVLPGHFASERFAVEALAEVLARNFPTLEVWASQQERDPLDWR